MEKRSLMTFISKLYQNEERRFNKITKKTEDFVPDFVLNQSAEAAINDDELTVEEAKKLISQMSTKIQSLQDRLFDYEDTNQLYSPEQLPQTHASSEELWRRFSKTLPSFIDVIIDSQEGMQDANFLKIQGSQQRMTIKELE